MPNIVVFLGAGVSKATFGLPSMIDLYQNFPAFLRNTVFKDYEKYYTKLLKILETKDNYYDKITLDIEAILTVLWDIASNKVGERFNHPTIQYILKKERFEDEFKKLFGDWDMQEANSILSVLKEFIIRECDISSKYSKIRERAYELYKKFFQTIYHISGQTKDFEDHIKKGIEIQSHCDLFTTNYDECLEYFCRRFKIHKNNGEIPIHPAGNIVDLRYMKGNPLYENRNFQIYKLHGSINWYLTEEDNYIHYSDKPAISGDSTPYGKKTDDVMIYPVTEKNIFREPFSGLFLSLKEKLMVVDECVITGYSFRDNEIKDIFKDALDRNEKNVKIYIFDPKANEIVKRFPDLPITIIPINESFNEKGINELHKKISGL